MSIEAMKQALEALESKYLVGCGAWRVQQDQAIAALRQAIEQAEKQKHAEQLAEKGWQYFECPACGSEGAKAFPKQEKQEPVAIDGNTSDGYHTFNELYEFRKAYNAALFNEWAAGGKCSVHKSWRHHDGELCFGGGWFIVVAVLPNGQISNHYEAKDWKLFDVPETERALFEFDGHTSIDVVARLKAYTTPPQRTEQNFCSRCGKRTNDIHTCTPPKD